MGAAVYMGMSLSDFFGLTPQEFFRIWEFNNKKELEHIYSEWNMVRTHACILLQPNIRKGSQLTPEKLIPLPQIDNPHHSATPKISKEEAKARLQKRLKQLEQYEHKNQE